MEKLPCGRDDGLGFRWVFGKDGLVAFLTCVDEQTHQRADQFQGQDAQNEVKIQPAGLGEGVLHAQDQEKHRAA